jgi:intein/homing endonuclease
MTMSNKKTIQKMKDWLENIFYRDYGEEQKEQRLKLITIDKTIEALKEHIAEQTDELSNDITETKGKIELLEKYRDRKPPYNNGASEEILTLICYGSLAYCVPGNTKILMWDFTWKSIKDVTKGENIVGLSRIKEKGKGNFFQITPNKIIATGSRIAKTLIIKTSDGKSIEITPEHPLLGETKCRGHGYRWRKAEVIKKDDIVRFLVPVTKIQSTEEYTRGWLSGYVEDGCFYNRTYYPKYQNAQRQFKIMSIDDELLTAFDKRIAIFGLTADYAKCFPSKNNQINNNQVNKKKFYHGRGIYKYKDAEKLEKICKYNPDGNDDYHRGFLAGIFDAEGTGYKSITISQTNEETIANITNSLDKLNFTYTVHDKKNSMNKTIRIRGGTSESLRFVAETRPILRRKVERLLSTCFGPSLPKLKVYSIENGRKTKVYNLETKTKNYIANGFIVHNCCGLKKACVWRDSALNLLEISAKDYERMKQDFHNKIMDGRVVHDKKDGN